MGTPPPKQVVEPVEHFDRDRKVLLSADYKEEQLRDTAYGRQLTAFRLRPSDSDSGRSAVGRKPMANPDGQVYEQFLGKVIKLTAGHQAKVEEKPEVRKAGGVHYTPQYIVNYIVKNTIGRLREGGPPARLSSARRSSKMQTMFARGRSALTDIQLNAISPDLQPIGRPKRPVRYGLVFRQAVCPRNFPISPWSTELDHVNL